MTEEGSTTEIQRFQIEEAKNALAVIEDSILDKDPEDREIFNFARKQILDNASFATGPNGGELLVIKNLLGPKLLAHIELFTEPVKDFDNLEEAPFVSLDTNGDPRSDYEKTIEAMRKDRELKGAVDGMKFKRALVGLRIDFIDTGTGDIGYMQFVTPNDFGDTVESQTYFPPNKDSDKAKLVEDLKEAWGKAGGRLFSHSKWSNKQPLDKAELLKQLNESQHDPKAQEIAVKALRKTHSDPPFPVLLNRIFLKQESKAALN